MSSKAEEYIRRHRAAAHAMQSGVAMEHARGSTDATPKHLRVGVNAAMSDHHGLVKLLIAKGVISEEEYLRSIAEAMEEEAKRYEKRLSESLGSNIKLE